MTKACDNCGSPMELELAKWQDHKDGLTPKNPNTVWTSDEHDDESNQYDNALGLIFFGGYGMFVDPIGSVEEKELTLMICHECAHALCDAFPGIGRIIRPFGSHAHSSDFIEHHPEHYGWDYLTEDERHELREHFYSI